MKYVKLIARPNTWFKAGTEVYDYNKYGKRLTLAELEKWAEAFQGYIKIENDTITAVKGSILLTGIRVCKYDYELELGYKVGEERQDGEQCSLDEFDIEIIDSEKVVDFV